MFEDFLDRYAHSNGIRNVNTYFKVLFGLITMIVSLVSTSPIIPLIIFMTVSFIILFKALIPIKFYLKFLTVPLTFATITFIFMAFFFGVGSNIYNLGYFNLGVTANGFNLGFLVFARILGGFACLAFLGLTTPLPELFSVMEDIKIPKILLEISMLMYRYVFVALDEAVKMYHAQETRLGYSGFKKSYKSMGILIANLFIKTWIMGERSYVAMESRGFDGSFKSMNDHHDQLRNIGIRNLMMLMLFEGILAIGVYFTGSFRIF
jgi:cobalt/nickel transport system permease protein